MKKNYRSRYQKNIKKKSYINSFITRFFLSIIIFLSILIYTNNRENLKLFKKYAIDKHISFVKINNLYNKYFGELIPIKKDKTISVFKENNDYKLTKYENGYIKSNKNKDVTILKEGIVVSINKTKKEGYTVIIQGIDEVDYTYSYLDSINVNMYDYVSKNSIIGHTKDKLYLSFKKNNVYLKYEELNQN